MAGYTRQSLADIQDGEDIVAAPLNAEFDQLQDAFNAVTGHTHDGTIGNGPKINLTGAAAVTGILPDANLPTTMGGKTFTSTVTIQNTLTIANPTTNSQIELGRTDAPTSSLIDFHSSGNAIDYDSRILATGGTGVVGNGALTYTASGGHTFVGSIILSTGGIISRVVDNSLTQIYGGTATNGANLELYGSTHATLPNRLILDADVAQFRLANGSGTPTVQIGGNTVWHAGNDGTGSGLDADLLDAQDSAFYRDASNINAGTLADARLPSTMTGKTFTSQMTLSSGAPIFQFTETDGGPKNWFLVADGTAFDIRENTTGTTRFRVEAGGNATFFQGLTVTGTLNGAAADFTGNITGVTYIASGEYQVRNSGNRVFRMMTAAGVSRGAVFHDNTNEAVNTNLYNSGGTLIRALSLEQGGDAYWQGPAFHIGFNSGTAEVRLNAGVNNDYRILGDTGGQFFIQKSTNEWSSATNLLSFNSSNNATFPAAVTVTTTLNLIGASQGIEIGARGVSNTPFIDFHSSATDADYQARIIASGGTGTAGSGTLTFDGNCVFNKNVVVGSATYQTDGNVVFASGMLTYGTHLGTALDYAQWRTQTWQNVAGSRVAGTSYQNTTGRPIMVSIQGTDSSSFEVSSNNSTWLTLADGDGDTDAGVHVTGGIIIPPNWYYRCNTGFTRWHELR